jgi:DNA-binding response OmpR family regulator
MKKNILMVDDDPVALQLLREILEAEGYEVLVFTEFESLLQELHRSLPALVITDVVMPKVSGFEVCRKIKEMFQPHPPPVIVMTGKLDAVDPVLARKMGADDFVVKTSDMAVLIQAVRKILPL